MTATALVLLAAACLLLGQAVRMGRRWGRGRPAGVELIAGIRRLPRAYLGTVHAAMSRDRRVARMHALVAGGTLAGVLFVLLHALTGVGIFAVLTLITGVAALAGDGIETARRRGDRDVHLSGGDFDRLPVALACLHAGLVISALGVWSSAVVTLLGALLTAIGAGWLVLKAARGPMRHAVAGTAHLVAHPRPERFEGKPATALLATEPRGIGEAEAFGWNRLAMFDACVQCGKCEAACPAFAAGQPLNPKKLVNDIVLSLGDRIGTDYAGHPHPEAGEARPLDQLVPGLADGPVAPETLWSCTTCRACVEACPMLIEHVDAVVDLRRFETQERGVVPEGVTDAILDIRETDTISGRALAERFDWAADLGLRVLEEGEACEVLLWAGDSAFDLRSQATLRALVRLLQRAGVDVAVLGAAELDCGDLARRMGDEATFTALARRNSETLKTRRIGRIVSADPHVVHCLSREYGAFGAVPETLHHTQLLNELVREGRLDVPVNGSLSVTYHDPCYLGRYLGETDAPRDLLRHLGLAPSEMTENGRRSRCCGGGGGAPLADVPGTRRVPDIRMAQAAATGAEVVVAACPYCTQMLEGVPGPRPEVRDVAELMWDAIGDAR